MNKIILSVIGLVVVVAGGWYLISNTPADTGKVVAVVNGEKILRTDFEAFKSQVAQQQGVDFASLDTETQSQIETQIVDELVAQALLRQAVVASGIVAAQENVDAQVATVVTQLGGQEAFNQALATEGISEEAFRTQINDELAARIYLEQELNLSLITATSEEIETTYAQAIAQDESIPPLEEVRVQVEQSVIQQKQQALVAQLLEKLRAEAEIEIFL